LVRVFSVFEKWTKKMSKIEKLKKLLQKNFKNFTTREGILFDPFLQIFMKFSTFCSKSL
jgi:hypothetical protein